MHGNNRRYRQSLLKFIGALLLLSPFSESLILIGWVSPSDRLPHFKSQVMLLWLVLFSSILAIILWFCFLPFFEIWFQFDWVSDWVSHICFSIRLIELFNSLDMCLWNLQFVALFLDWVGSAICVNFSKLDDFKT
jgi:hypothetical protein